MATIETPSPDLRSAGSDTGPAFDNSYARLPDRFYAKLPPKAPKEPRFLRINEALAGLLNLNMSWLKSPEGLAMLSGQAMPRGAEPLAMAYAGHQFGGFSPQLGDGRAHLIGEVIGSDCVRYDIQLKGSGQTPFSRMGDGLAGLGPVLREYIISEAMYALGVPTTRSLAAVTTGGPVIRERVLPGAVLTRVARGHVRVGTFEYFAARQDVEGLKTLTDYALRRFYPEAADSDNPARALLDGVITAQARLIARWMGLGFIHGVMNTDNCSISGETIDYGPCAFMDDYHPGRVYSSIDHGGRYAFGNQPSIAHWNVARFGQALLPILADDQAAALKAAQEAIDAYPAQFEEAYLACFRAKLGLAAAAEDDVSLIQDFLAALDRTSSDFTNSFRFLPHCLKHEINSEAAPSFPGAIDRSGLKEWLPMWHARLEREPAAAEDAAARMNAANPAFIPRNHRVEEAIAHATDKQDLAPFEALVEVLSRPYEDQPDRAEYRNPPKPEQVVAATFCGT